jgi:N-acetylglucosamine kinase-like BadF-type ATPase
MSKAAAFLLGVDGGNTKTIAAIARSDGEIVGVARGGGSDIYAAETPEKAIDEICRVVREAAAKAGVGVETISASSFSLAGADWPEDFELLDRELPAQLGLTHRPRIVNDSLGALRSGSPKWEGIAVACGTFNAIAARNRDGKIFHLGFWPDQRGGFDLGLATLKAAYRDAFDLGPATSLTRRVLETFGEKDGRALMHGFTRRQDRRSIRDVSRLTPILLDEADAGDALARSMVVEAGKILGDQARSSAKHVNLPLPGALVVLTGGVLKHPSTLLANSIMSCLPGAVAVRTSLPPIAGALMLSFDDCGIAVVGEGGVSSAGKVVLRPLEALSL